MKDNLKPFLIQEDISVKDAMKQMDRAGRKILFIVDAENRILGVVTDGDIRRWILKEESLDESISQTMNRNPIYITEGQSAQEAKKLMASRQIECIPVVDKDKKIISAIWWIEVFDGEFKRRPSVNLPVVIMAGGKGQRLSPANKVLPKPLMLIKDKPAIELIIDKFAEFGCKELYLSLNYKSNIIKAYFSDIEHDCTINFVEETEPLGTVGSLHLLKGKIKTSFYLTNCDILVEADYADILRFHRKRKNKITLVVSMKHYIIPYGICETSKGGVLETITEKPEYDFLVNTGMYVMEPDVLKDIPVNKHYDITDLLSEYNKKGKKVGVYPVSEKSWLDMGQWQQLQDTMKSLGVE